MVSGDGAFFFLHPKPTFISTSLAGKCLGFGETEHGIWSVYYYNALLGRLNEGERTVYT